MSGFEIIAVSTVAFFAIAGLTVYFKERTATRKMREFIRSLE